MQLLKEAIETKGRVIDDKIIKIDSFLNHQVDVELVSAMADDLYEHYKDAGITKIITLETSGIAPAFATALKMNVPFVFIKKAMPSTMMNPVTTKVFSFTKNKVYEVCMERDFVSENDKVLFIDDFLANGEAFKACETLIKACGAELKGVGIVVEKAFQNGHKYIVDKGYDLYCLASIDTIKDGKIIWAD
ncbi:MAG: xanthine phosphoribosyltransferase [Holdemanella sp.]|nr:xanthine phosphoribosyltransferase [Holdemanella sp.]